MEQVFLRQIEADASVVMAGLLCDLFEKKAETPDALPPDLAPKLKELLIRLDAFNPQHVQWEDEEVLMIKLEQRLHNMRTIAFMKESARTFFNRRKKYLTKTALDVIVNICRATPLPPLYIILCRPAVFYK